MTDLANTEHVGNRHQDAMLPSIGPVWCTHSIVLTVKGGSALTRWYFKTVFRVFLVKKHAAFKRKDTISGFPVSPVSAEALVTCGWKIKYILIVYFLRNICTKNCRNRTVYVTRRPASDDRTARRQFQAGLKRRRRTLIDGYLESPFPTACLL